MSDRDFFGDLQGDENKEENPFAGEFQYKEPQEKSFPVLGILLGLIVGIIIAFFIGRHFLGSKSQQDSQNEVPIIRADQEPDKMIPEDKGGMEIPNQDKEIYSLGSFDEQAEKLLDQKQPVTAPITSTPETKNLPAKDVTIEPVKTPEPEQKQPIDTQTPQPSQTKSALDQVVQKTTATPAVKSSTSSASNKWQVQLVAVKDQTSAEKTWTDLKKKFPDLLGNQQYTVIRKDLGANGGIVYRLRVHQLSKTEATNLCNALKKRNTSCFVSL